MVPKDNVKKLNRTSTKSFLAWAKKTLFLYLFTISFKVTGYTVSIAAMVAAGNKGASKRVQFFFLLFLKS